MCIRSVVLVVASSAAAITMAATADFTGAQAAVPQPSGPVAKLPARDGRPERPQPRTGAPDKRTEVIELRTATSRTYRTSRGTLVAKLFTEPVNFRDAAGQWRAINNDLTASDGAYVNAANDYEVRLPENLSEAVEARKDDVGLSFELAGADARASVTDNEAQYRNALPGVTATYSAEADKVKETLVLADRQATRGFKFAVTTTAGLQARQAADGGIDFVDGAGGVRMRFQPPFMRDQRPGNDGLSTDVKLTFGATSNGRTLVELKPSDRWLDDPGTQFPVVIDPIVDFNGANQDCYVSGGASADKNFCQYGNLDVGRRNGVPSRALLKFDVGAYIPRDSQILDAELGLYLGAKTSTTQTTVSAHALQRAWSGQINGATWNRFDGVNRWTTPGGDFASSSAASTQAGGSLGWQTWHPTALVQGWVDQTVTNSGLLLRGDESTEQLLSFDSTYSRYRTPPYLSVEYEPRVGDLARYTFERRTVTPSLEVGVNPANGNLLVRETDFSLDASQLDYGIEHFYNNLSPNTGTTGGGWTTSVGQDVGLIFYTDGSIAYDGPSGYTVPFTRQPDGSFKGAPGVGLKLAKLTDGSYSLTDVERAETYFFDTNGYLVRKVDEDGGRIDYVYTSGRLTSLNDNAGRRFSFTYDMSGFLATMTDAAGGRHVYGHDSVGRLLSYTSPTGARTDYGYDRSFNLVTITPSAGRQQRITYDTAFRVTSITDVTSPSTGTGLKTTYGYGAGATTSTDPAGRRSTYAYDETSMVTSSQAAVSPPALALSGPLYDQRNASLDPSVEAYDLSFTGSAPIGVPSGQVTLGRDVGQDYQQPCDPGCGDLSGTWTLDNFDPIGGERIITVAVTDREGDRTTRSFRVTVPPQAPSPEAPFETPPAAQTEPLDVTECEQYHGAGSPYCQPPAESATTDSQPATLSSPSSNSTLAASSTATATSPSSLIYGIADQDARYNKFLSSSPKFGSFLNDPRFTALKIKRVRQILPYNLLEGCSAPSGTGCRFPRRLADFRDFYELAITNGQEVVVSFEAGCSSDLTTPTTTQSNYCPITYRKSGTNTPDPSGDTKNAAYRPEPDAYIAQIRRFKRYFPAVAAISAWNEPNLSSTQPIALSSTGAPRGALYTYLVERDVCSRQQSGRRACRTLAAEVLDSTENYLKWTRVYRDRIKRYFDANNDSAVRYPATWVIHPYSDTRDEVAQFGQTFTYAFFKAASAYSTPRFWYTEVGGRMDQQRPNTPAGQAREIDYLVGTLATPNSSFASRIDRLYYYNFCNAVPDPNFDAGLVEPGARSDAGCRESVPRAAYNTFKSYSVTGKQ